VGPSLQGGRKRGKPVLILPWGEKEKRSGRLVVSIFEERGERSGSLDGRGEEGTLTVRAFSAERGESQLKNTPWEKGGSWLKQLFRGEIPIPPFRKGKEEFPCLLQGPERRRGV